MADPLIVGIGNELRGDDGAGLRLVELLTRMGVDAYGHDGEPLTLIESFERHDRVVIVDAVAGLKPGAVHRFDAVTEPLPALFATRSSTHLLGLAETLELSRELGRLPAALEVIGIEGADFELGAPMSAPVEATASQLAEELATEAREAGRLLRISPRRGAERHESQRAR